MAGGTLAATIGFARNAHAAANDDTIKIALVGCGGRGTGAAGQALSTSGKVKLVAMADVFPDRLNGSLAQLMRQHKDRIDVPEERKFTGDSMPTKKRSPPMSTW